MTTTISCGHSHKGLVRTLNEDATLLLPDHGVWAVADGMGGHSAGDVASQIVVDTLKEIIERDAEPKPALIERAIEEANTRVLQHYNGLESGAVGGSTVVVLLVSRSQYHVFWLGDSRLYLYRRGQLTLLTRDHSQVNEMVEQGLITLDQAEKHELANVITRAVGVESSIRIDQASGDINEHDVFLLCSDGLNKEVSELEIGRILQNSELEATNKALIHLSLLAGARDNVTSVLVKVTEEAPIENTNIHQKVGMEDKTVPTGICPTKPM